MIQVKYVCAECSEDVSAQVNHACTVTSTIPMIIRGRDPDAPKGGSRVQLGTREEVHVTCRNGHHQIFPCMTLG